MSEPLELLLVEDSESDAGLILRQLRRAGYDIHAARVETAEQMRAALAEQSWHLVICDHSMPQFDSPAALAVLQQAGGDIPFIIVSGTIDEDLAVAMMRAGAHDYLNKANLARLAPAVARELREAQVRRARRQAEEEVARQAREWQATFDATNDVIWVLDRELRIVRANRTTERILRRTVAELLGQPCCDIMHEGQAGTECPARRMQASLHREVAEVQWNACWYELSADPIVNGDGQLEGALYMIRDINVRKLAERQIHDQLTELQRWYNVTLDREMRTLELKSEVNDLLRRLNEPIRYPSALDT